MILLRRLCHFCGGKKQDLSFETLKTKLTHAPILVLHDFSKAFELECDASRVGIGVMLIEGGHPVAFFSEKLNDLP